MMGLGAGMSFSMTENGSSPMASLMNLKCAFQWAPQLSPCTPFARGDSKFSAKEQLVGCPKAKTVTTSMVMLDQTSLKLTILSSLPAYSVAKREGMFSTMSTGTWCSLRIRCLEKNEFSAARRSWCCSAAVVLKAALGILKRYLNLTDLSMGLERVLGPYSSEKNWDR